jgi:dTDP-D-glucose 4,6-dehydratase
VRNLLLPKMREGAILTPQPPGIRGMSVYTILTEAGEGRATISAATLSEPISDVVSSICRLLDEMLPTSPHRPHERLITLVADRRGHDRRYAMDIAKIQRELCCQPRETFDSGLRETVSWYLENRCRWEPIWSRHCRRRAGGSAE